MGLTTCLALLLSQHGKLRIATAGHPAPYLNGNEIDLPGDLPLGVVGDHQFEDRLFQLSEKDHLLLLTDGVPEAMNEKHNLFGWERTQAVSRHAAQEVASAAQSFGQADDITVVTVTYAG